MEDVTGGSPDVTAKAHTSEFVSKNVNVKLPQVVAEHSGCFT
jgi:hypothetical protein